ncbi:MAG: hypothetical protein IJ690_04015 [Clostridia bacterium]|nr:hypothetical protein [Clostridia bacterium]
MKVKNDKKNELNSANKHVNSSAIVILLLIIILISTGIAAYAWAKYSTKQNGSATADIARWSFKVNSNSEQSLDNIDFSITRTDSNRQC